jgi:LEA14-like dessication related protein
MRRRFVQRVIALMLLVGSGCATLGPDYETPAVNVSSIRALPSESIVPRFEIGLHIVNPNRSPLALQGIAYTLKLEGHKLLTGVANDLPTIEGYGEGEVTLVASTNLLGGIRFFTEMMKSNPDTITYDLEAKLDPGGIQPVINVVESGEFSLSDQSF